jgi:putative ABC transport system permease protein
MIKNYLIIAWRNILKNKSFSLINIVGLATSMAVCLLIIAIVADQKSYDQFHTKKDRIYRILSTGKGKNQMEDMATSALPLGEELRKNYTGIAAAASALRSLGGDLIYNDKIATGGGYFTDANLFNILDFKLLEGNPATALENPRSLVISEELANQLFYKENPIGKVVKFNHTDFNPAGVDHGNKETAYGEFTITGVLKPNAGKTHLPFKILASLSSIPTLAKDSIVDNKPNDWEDIFHTHTYVLMQEGKNQADLQAHLDKISDKFYPKEALNPYGFKAEPLMSITPGETMGNNSHVSIPRFVLYFLGILSLIVMLSACLNYTNLSIARALTRAKEIGIRKVSGATKGQVFGQFITESVVISLLSLGLSIGILLVLEFLFSKLVINQYFQISFSLNANLILIFIGFSVLVGLIAGLLPSFYMSAFSPIQILKNTKNIKLFKRLTLRKILLTTQFIVSLIFIISTVLIYQQTNLVFNFDYGFDKNNVVNINLYKADNYDRFAQAIASNKDVLAVSACDFLPATGRTYGASVHKADSSKDNSLGVNFIDIDDKCVDVWGLKIIAGNNLPDIPSPSKDEHILINEKMAEELNYKTPNEAVGQWLASGSSKMQIVGVVKDFQFSNVHEGITPFMFRNRQDQFGYATVKIAGKNAAETVAALEKTWRGVNPNTRFEYEYFDQQLLMTHAILSNVGSILGFIALLAVLISCLGLLGMATYTAETRQKEIGVRKVLGSSVPQIILLLSKDYMLLIGIAVVIATPVAYLLNAQWLEFFSNRVSITPLVLLGCIVILLLISFLTVFSQSWRAARANPVKSLRTE